MNFSKFPPLSQVLPSKDKIPEHLVSKKYKHWRWRMFIGMYIGYTIFYFTRKNISPALPLISEKLDIDIIQLGILSSVFYVVYGIGKFISGLLADRANIRMFMAIGLFLASLIHLFIGFLDSLYLIVFFWGLNGAFQSMGFPPIAKGLVHWFSPRERATKWTILSSSHTAGTFGIGLLVAGIINLYNKGVVGWEAVFYVPGIIGCLTAIFLFITLRDRPVSLGLPPIEDHKNERPIVELIEKSKSHWELLKKHIFTNKYIWLLSLANMFIYIIRFGTLDWATIFLYDIKGIDQVQVAIFWTLMPLAGIPGGIVAGYLADKFWNGRCVPINVIYLVLLTFSIVVFYFYSGPNNIILTGVFLLLIGFLIDGPQNLISGVQASRVTVKQAISAACGMTGFFGYVGATFSGIGLAYITESFGWMAMYGVCALSSVLCLILVLMTYKKEKGHS
ncbi:regulatory UhpC-like protein [Formosa sp. Hel1_33_131]|uniref:MFS transporter n=1 Tax=Formosa sp. Hel1_33_131 TaxID=1336794 RepID=UPI00084E23AC|nr:MFS transporter [Formosa sp. Hel1_33_131]AOR28476.1 regulatory UhpC-like protein [Formosa sp. Hel1_33_131]